MAAESDIPSTEDVRDIWVDHHLNLLPRCEGIALVPTYQAAFDGWLAARPVTVTPEQVATMGDRLASWGVPLDKLDALSAKVLAALGIDV